MKLKFKTQAYQTAAVQAVVDCFKGQPPASAEAISYRIDPGKAKEGEGLFEEAGFKNVELKLTDIALLENITQKAAKACDGKPYHLEGDAGANMVVATQSHLGSTPTSVLGLKAVCDEAGRSNQVEL